MDHNHYRKLERMYLHANVNKEIYQSTRCKFSNGKAEISMDISPKFFHALEAVHGSVYFKLLDDVCFFAANSVVEDAFVLTTSFNINLLRPVSSGRITAKGKLDFQSSNLFVANGELYDENERLIAKGNGQFVKSKIELSPEIGYI